MLGWLVTAVSGSALVLLCWIAGHRRPPGLDTTLHAWLLEHRWRPLTDVAIGVTLSGTGVVAYGLAALAGAILMRSRRTRKASLLVGALAADAMLAAVQGGRAGLASLIGRPRPPRVDWAFPARGHAFPSGHTTTSATVAVMLVMALRVVPSSSPPRRLWVFVTVGWACAVGLSRAYLGMHWPTDVLGGWALVATVCATVGSAWWTAGAAMQRVGRAQ